MPIGRSKGGVLVRVGVTAKTAPSETQVTARSSAAARTVSAKVVARMRLQDRVSPRRLPVALFVVAVSTLAGLVTADSELEVVKVVSQPFALEVTTLYYTITVSNPSAPDNTGGLLVEHFPPELSDCFWTCTEGGAANCEQTSGSGSFEHIAWVPFGSSLSYEIECSFTPYISHRCALNTVTLTTMDPDTETSATATTCQTGVVFEDTFETGDLDAW